MTAAQLPLSLDFRPALGREDFLVAPCNQEAVAWIDRWPNWPGPAMCLAGPVGSGRTHLAEVWRARSGARSIPGRLLGLREPPDWLEGGPPALVIEDAEDHLDEVACFHLFNMLTERGGHVLFTAHRAPARWPVRLADLKSRLGLAVVAEIRPPDDALLGGLLIKLFADRRLAVGPQVIGYVLPRLERSFAAARAFVAAVDRAALAARRPVSLALVKRVLQTMEGLEDGSGIAGP